MTQRLLSLVGPKAPPLAASLKQRVPFAAAALLAWAVIPIAEPVSWKGYSASLAVLAIAGGFGGFATLRRNDPFVIVFGSLVFLVAIALARQATGGEATGVGMLTLLAVFEGALHLRRRRDLAVVLVGVAAFYLLPIAIVGAPQYPSAGIRSALIAIAISCVIGLATQELITDIWRRSQQAQRRERMLVSVRDTVQKLFESPNVRADLCSAVKETCEATAVLIYEAPVDSTALHCTATSFEIPESVRSRVARPESAVYEAFNSGEAVFVDDMTGQRVGNPAMWKASGQSKTILFQPLMKRDVAIGVLVVGWDEAMQLSEQRVVVASLLAHEGAAVIDRADVLNQLTDEAYTDPLTGLPNRRAWAESVAWADAERRPVAVAILDLDRFKSYNDTHGHPAGDRLLREAAAIWSAEIRSGDLLARIGGEEFALLVTDTHLSDVEVFVDRLRSLTPLGQTCSAGIAFRAPNESVEQIVSRADQALYRAKNSGRNRALIGA